MRDAKLAAIAEAGGGSGGGGTTRLATPRAAAAAVVTTLGNLDVSREPLERLVGRRGQPQAQGQQGRENWPPAASRNLVDVSDEAPREISLEYASLLSFVAGESRTR